MELTKYYGHPDLDKSADWLTISSGKDSMKLRVAPYANIHYEQGKMKYNELMAAAIKSQMKEDDELELTPEMAKDINDMNTRLTAEFILINWEGIEDRGNKLEYTLSNAIDLLNTYPALEDQVINKALDLKVARDEMVAKLKKK